MDNIWLAYIADDAADVIIGHFSPNLLQNRLALNLNDAKHNLSADIQFARECNSATEGQLENGNSA